MKTESSYEVVEGRDGVDSEAASGSQSLLAETQASSGARAVPRGLLGLVGVVAVLGCTVAVRRAVAGQIDAEHGESSVSAAVELLEAAGACGSPGEDCTKSKCCKDAGMQCYTKTPYFATCRAVCTPGMKEKDGEPWACEKLGEPAPFELGPSRCAWSGENCIAKKCCNDANMKCFQKDNYFAGCLFTPEKPESGWVNTQLGEFRGWSQITNPAPAGEPIQGSKLYCFYVQSPNGRVEEDKMIASARAKGVGVFSCDENSVYMGAVAPRTAWQSIGNTDIFINVWNQVMADGKWWHNDWTVKVDPDAVFFGQRLKMHLEKLRVPKDSPVYIKNCNFKFRFQGSLEIFSQKAMESLHNYKDMCAGKIGHDGGEDFFIMTCMDAMGVGAMEDDSVLYDKYATGEHLVLDDVSMCHNGWTAAFHPFRTVDVWDRCVTAAWDAEAAYNRDHPGGR